MQPTEPESIKKFYEGADVFITGGSGYIGKVLIEKLLRSCPGINKIYLLLRPSKAKTAHERIQQFSNNLLYEGLKRSNPNWMDKIHAIAGDVLQIDLGVSEADREKLKTCSVIFHAAASVRFDDPLKSAILLNTRGTREVCKLALTMPHLKAFVHVSTAYIEPRNFYVEEIVYPFDADWRNYIDFAERFDEDTLSCFSPKLTRFAPNTYTFTKHLAEQVCIDYKNEFNLPIVLFRPSIVAVTEVEPIPAWTDSLNGPAGMMIVAALGISHVTFNKETSELNLIPVDICVKGLIIAAYKTSRDKLQAEAIPVYNAASIKIHTQQSFAAGSDAIYENPSLKAVSTPSYFFTECVYYGWILRIFLDIIPALILDGLLCITGNQPRLLKTHRLIINAEKSLRHFSSNTFKIDNFKFNDLNLAIPPHEKKEFFINETLSDNVGWFKLAYKNILQEILKESPADLPKARKRYLFVRFFAAAYRLTLCFVTFWLVNRLILNFGN